MGLFLFQQTADRYEFKTVIQFQKGDLSNSDRHYSLVGRALA